MSRLYCATNHTRLSIPGITSWLYDSRNLVTRLSSSMAHPVLPLLEVRLILTPGCDNAQLVSALNSEDAGTNNIGNVFTNGFPYDLVNAAFGQNLASASVSSKIPPVGTGASWGSSECLKRCGIFPANNATYGN